MPYDESSFRRLLQPHRRALQRLELDLRFFFEEAGPVVLVAIEQRLKSYDSDSQKAKQRGVEIDELNDLAGLRVVCGTVIDTELICHFFENGLRGVHFKVLENELVDRGNGYRARHLVIEVPSNYIGMWRTCKVEVQVLTTFQDAFNRLSRGCLYKSDRALQEQTCAGFRKLSDSLRELDQHACSLQLQVFEDKDASRDSDPLVMLAYKSIVEECLGEKANDGEAIWHTLFYRRLGVETCGGLRAFFSREDIAEWYEEWLMKAEGDEFLMSMAETKERFWEMVGTRPDMRKLFAHIE